jgi:hypothetical protein
MWMGNCDGERSVNVSVCVECPLGGIEESDARFVGGEPEAVWVGRSSIPGVGR